MKLTSKIAPAVLAATLAMTASPIASASAQTELSSQVKTPYVAGQWVQGRPYGNFFSCMAARSAVSALTDVSFVCYKSNGSWYFDAKSER